MSKLGLDAVIQRDIAEDTRNSAFARSETALQLSWVVGGAFGLLPMPGWLGFAFGSAFIVIALHRRIGLLAPGPALPAAVAGHAACALSSTTTTTWKAWRRSRALRCSCASAACGGAPWRACSSR